MRALAPPRDRAPTRQAAAQPAAEGVTSALYTKRGNIPGRGTDAQYLQQYNDWQGFARRFARQVGAASFNALVVSDLCGRCDVRVEQRVAKDEWVPFDDARYVGIMDLYANELQGPDELIRLHAWHYEVAGEMAQVQRDRPGGGVEYGIYSMAALEWDKPNEGDVTVKLLPDGKVDKDTAFVVPRDHVVRFWMPDQEWFAYAWSPMAAAIDDLKRYRALQKYALKTADSAVAMSGLLWAPGEAFVEPAGGSDAELDEAASDAGVPKSALEELYYSIASLRSSNSEDVTSVAPPLFHWDRELGKPEWVKLGDALDPHGIEHRHEALEDYARATRLPVTTVLGGGVGDANHWSEWLASAKMFDSGVAPTMDRICHLDLTRSFLWPHAILAGADPTTLRDLRIGYDPTDVIVHPDLSDKAIRLHLNGLLSEPATLEACGFDEAERMTDRDQRAWLLEVLAHGRLATQPAVTPGSESVAPTDGATTLQRPPSTNGSPLRAATEPPPFVPGEHSPPPVASVEAARAALDRLTRLRQALGTKLLAETELAYESALTQARAKFKTRARARSTRQRAVTAAVDAGEALRPFMAVVGLKEHELLASAFNTFRARALAELALYRERADAVIAGLDVDVRVPTESDAASAVDYLVTALTASVRARLLDGDNAAVVAAAPTMVPRAPRPPAGGFDMPGLPDPDELARAAARLVRNALSVNEGRADWKHPPTPDQLPGLTFVDAPTIEEQTADALGAETTSTWVHGFYGEPGVEFEPHANLDGFSTTDREGDEGLVNPEGWPEDMLYPGDHDGCCCEWVEDVIDIPTVIELPAGVP